jgi:hypothetical protein
MNKPLNLYRERSRRVALLMAWLGKALEQHDQRVAEYADPNFRWHMVGRLARVESELKPLVGLIATLTEGAIEQALDEGGFVDD